jgi:hypothetical protein
LPTFLPSIPFTPIWFGVGHLLAASDIEDWKFYPVGWKVVTGLVADALSWIFFPFQFKTSTDCRVIFLSTDWSIDWDRPILHHTAELLMFSAICFRRLSIKKSWCITSRLHHLVFFEFCCKV